MQKYGKPRDSLGKTHEKHRKTWGTKPRNNLEKLDEKNISDLLKKNQNKMIIFVLTNLLDNKLVIKFQNYKKLYFISDKSYSVHTALKSDMILFSKKSSIYNSYIGSN